MSEEFEGFESANTTPVPDVLFDQLLAKLSGTELKVLLYIIRRTHGFKKVTDAISLSQFTDGIKTREGKQLDKGCGVKNRTAVSHALANLEKMHCIKSTKGQDPVGDAAVSLYSIHFTPGVVQNAYHRSAKRVPPVVQTAYYRSTEGVPGVVQNAYPQETVLQETDRQQDSIQERAASPSSNETHAHAFSENEHDSYRHDHTRKDDDWRCRNWQIAHHGTCEDYQAWIERGGRDEPTEPRIEAIGAPDGFTPTSNPVLPVHGAGLPDRSHSPVDLRTQEQTLAIASTPLPADRGLPAGERQSHPLPDVNPLASGVGTREQTPSSLSEPTASEQSSPSSAQRAGGMQTPSTQQDGAALAAREGSEPRASDESCVTTENGKVTQESILSDWDAVNGRPVPRDDRLRKAARDLVRASPTREELRGCLEWLPKTDNPKTLWYHTRGVGLWDIAEKLGNYRHHLALSINPAPLADMPKQKPMDIYTANSKDKEKMRRRIDEAKANALAKGLQIPGRREPEIGGIDGTN